MNNDNLDELIQEAQNRGGGMLLNMGDKPAAVVLTIDRYNQLLGGQGNAAKVTPAAKPRAAASENGARRVLVTGGAGYIGSHLVRQLLESGYKVTVLDNLSYGRREHVPADATLIEGDLADINLLRDVLADGRFEAVLHMAASIEVEESVREPEKYYENNVANTGKLLVAMKEAGVANIIFSSTAAVYGEQAVVPIPETAPLRPNNPYGATKLLGERMIKYFCDYAGFRAVVFRYFNACGCDFDGRISLTHHSHLIPVVMEVAGGRRPHLLVNGNDYPTLDGTCVRDYVHVLDIARAHVVALDHLANGGSFRVYNIGTGKGLSVAQIISGAAEVLNKIIPMEIGPRRPGDSPATVADNRKLHEEMGFLPKHSDIQTIISTSWNQIARNQIEA